MKRAWMIALVLAACSSTPKKEAPSDAFVTLDRPGPLPLVTGEFEVTSWRLANESGLVKYEVTIRNLRSGANSARVQIRFFDESLGSEYEKVPLISAEAFSSGESKRLEGSVDFRGMPEGAKVAKIGISVRCGRP